MTRSSLMLFVVVGLTWPALAAETSSSKEQAQADTRDRTQRAAAHAHLLSQVQWSPVADTMPNRKGGYFEKGKVYTGVPYSSVKSVGRYIGFDISLRTFLAAVENPQSVLYTEDLRGRVANSAPYYGTVCSGLTCYSLQCGIWKLSWLHGPKTNDGVVEVQPQSGRAAEVGDVIYTPYSTPTSTSGGHVELVTEVERDSQGRVIRIRVEESAPPTTRTTDRTPEEFDAHLAKNNKQLFRITDFDAWRGGNRAESFLFPNYEADSVKPEINRTLLLDLGDWVPYEKGRPVKFNVMDRDGLGVSQLVIQRCDEVVERIALQGPGVHERSFDVCGNYSAYVVRPDGSKSPACEFAVCDLQLQLPPESVPANEDLQVGFSSDNIKVIAIYLWNDVDRYGHHSLFLSDDDRRKGSTVVPGKLLNHPGEVQVWLIGEHPLGRLKLRKDIKVF